MRLERVVGDKTYWLELKDAWTQRDLRQWRQAGSLAEADFTNNEAIDDAEMRVNAAKLALLQTWCSSCYLVDVDGNEYHEIAQVTAEAVSAMDAPLYQMFHNAASEAFARRATLGEARGGRL